MPLKSPMLWVLVGLVVCLWVGDGCEGSHVVLFPHYYPGDLTPFLSLGKSLIQRGHRVTVTLPSHLFGYVSLQDGFEIVSWGDNLEIYTDINKQAEGFSKAFEESDYSAAFSAIAYMFDDMAREIFRQGTLMSALRANPPDIIITFPMGIGMEVADILNVPSISLFTQSDFLSIAAHDAQAAIGSGLDGFHTPVVGKMSFWDRYAALSIKTLFSTFFSFLNSQTNGRRVELHNLPPVDSLSLRGGGNYPSHCLFMVNGFYGWTTRNFPLYPNVKLVGPLVYAPKRKTTQTEREVFDFIAKSDRKIVYISLGTSAPITEEHVNFILKVSMKYNVIWSASLPHQQIFSNYVGEEFNDNNNNNENNDDYNIHNDNFEDENYDYYYDHNITEDNNYTTGRYNYKDDLGTVPSTTTTTGTTPRTTDYHRDRIFISNWLPQYAILDHPKVQGFVTHGGLNGIYESVLAGVPCLCGGILFDQPLNCEKIHHYGMGKRVDFEQDNEEYLFSQLKEVMEGESYHQKVNEMRELAEWNKGRQEAVQYVEYVLKFKEKTFDHFFPAEDHYNFIERGLYDVIFLSCVLWGILLFLSWKSLSGCLGCCCRRQPRERA